MTNKYGKLILLTFQSQVHRCHQLLNHIITFAIVIAFDDCTDTITIRLQIIINSR